MLIVNLVLSCIIATTLMTAFSYLMSAISRQQFREPELLNGLLNGWFKKSFSKNSPAGWLIHYGVGLMFIIAYYFVFQVWEPTLLNYVIIGFTSGLIGAGVWFAALNIHPLPPSTNRKGHYAQLVPAHVVFTLGAYINYCFLGLQ
ncbi:MAG: hypothetical protein JNJ75_16745 [Cyclobacteriaceae bacterium]|nr:hypothetical protein [Cyclobacteriaceae bacterium]